MNTKDLQQIAVARKEKGLTQKECAKLLGISPMYLCDIEKGRRCPQSDEFYNKVRDILGLSFVNERQKFLIGIAVAELRDQLQAKDEMIKKLKEEKEIYYNALMKIQYITPALGMEREMTDLTELWEKGELPSGEYYIIDDLGLSTTDKYFKGTGFGIEKPQKILDMVPAYNEWKEAREQIHKNGIWYTERAYKTVKKDAKTLAQTLLKVSPEHKSWLEKDYKEYL